MHWMGSSACCGFPLQKFVTVIFIWSHWEEGFDYSSYIPPFGHHIFSKMMSKFLSLCFVNTCCSYSFVRQSLALIAHFPQQQLNLGSGRNYSLSIIQFYWHKCFYEIAIDFQLKGTKILNGKLQCNSTAHFQSHVNGFLGIVTLDFPKHCPSWVWWQSVGFIGGLFWEL